MENLIWIEKGYETLNLSETPFRTEEQLEKKVYDEKILEKIHLLSRQPRHGNKSGIPDIIGMDDSGNVCIIEIKNTAVDSDIIPQVLSYALWAERSPDSIQKEILKSKNPDILKFAEREHYEVKIVIIAPEIKSDITESISKINYETDLLELKRWMHKSKEFILIRKIESVDQERIKPLQGLKVYDREFYEKTHNKQSVNLFLKAADKIDEIIKEHKWPLERKFNKYYCTFKDGNSNVFNISWRGTRSFAINFTLAGKIVKKHQPKNIPMEEYYHKSTNESWVEYKIKSVNDINTLLPQIKKAWQHWKT